MYLAGELTTWSTRYPGDIGAFIGDIVT
jgi:hypothetical protein